ncbi:sel1 repeat family protein, partial [Aliiglaciecola sp.]|nr:sel1 repeat family protein [Aliiglaciecola sp.]
GITVAQDTTLFEELMSSAQQYYRPGEAWFKFASLYNTEFGGKRRELAIKYTFNSAEQGFLRGKLTLLKIRASEADAEDSGEAKDIENEVKTLAEKGLTEAQVIYSQLLFRRYEQGSEQWTRAQHWIELASEKGHPVANFLRGVAFEYGYFGTKDFFEAYRYYNDAALNYHADSQLKIGYFNGIGRVVEKNKALAILWYSLCAKSDNLECIRNLAINHMEGTVEEPNYELARFLFKYAADKGHISSKTSLGVMYLYGKGIDVDYPLANKLFEQACTGKDGEACQYLATSYQKGKGVEIDLSVANQLYTKSCDLNNYGGCLGLAIMYEVGDGVEINTSKAKSYFKRACQLGSNISCHKANGLLN